MNSEGGRSRDGQEKGLEGGDVKRGSLCGEQYGSSSKSQT